MSVPRLIRVSLFALSFLAAHGYSAAQASTNENQQTTTTDKTQAAPNNTKPDTSAAVTFHARSELILVPTLVTDKSGAHISGLKKEDFTVFENGAPRSIVTFEEITSDPHLVRPVSPNEFSNSVGTGAHRRVTVIVLDFINTHFADQAFLRNELLRYISQSLDRREPTGLFTLTRDGVHLIHDFTTDPRILIAAIHKLRGDASSQLVDTAEDMELMTGSADPQGSATNSDGSGGGGTSGGHAGSGAAVQAQVEATAARMQAMIEDAALNFQSFQQRIAITLTLEGMQQVAQSLAGLPGRKSIIWASGGFPFSVSNTTMQLAPAGRDSLTDVLPLYERTWHLLNDSEIALYPIDVKGLTSGFASASIANPGGRPGRPQRTNWHRMDTQDTFEVFAAATGGRAYFNCNDLVKGFREAVDDSAQYYMLGYYLDQSDRKIGWRKLSVKVHRDHVEIRSRNGFYVTKETVDSGANLQADRDRDIGLALASPLDYTALPFTGHWDPFQSSPDGAKKRAIYVVEFPAHAALMDANDKNHIAIQVLSSVKTPAGLQVDRILSKKIEVYPKPDVEAKIREKGLSYRGAVDLAPGNYSVRIVVCDELTGRIGSVTTPLKVE
jgi:VWFA-related protein